MEDIIKMTVLKDGTIRTETPTISAANHVAADELLKLIEQLAGGKVTIEQRAHHGHHHDHDHEHDHLKGGHSH